MIRSRVMPSARAVKVSAMRWRSTGGASAITSSTEGARRSCSSARTRTASIRAWLARGPGPQPISSLSSPSPSRRGPPGAHQPQDRVDHAVADRDAAHQGLRLDQLARGHHRLGRLDAAAGGLDHHAALGRLVGIVDVDLQQEAVELRLGQRVGALLLDRVLGRQHVERLRQPMVLPGDRHHVLLHRLQQRRLGARAGAVDLVRHQQLAEHRARNEAEAAPPALGFLQHLGAENVGRHQVGGELHALLRQAEHHAERLDQPRLGEARHADQQHMTARQQRDKRFLDDPFLAEDRAADLGADPGEPLDRRLDLVEDRRVMRLVQWPILDCGGP